MFKNKQTDNTQAKELELDSGRVRDPLEVSEQGGEIPFAQRICRFPPGKTENHPRDSFPKPSWLVALFILPDELEGLLGEL